MNADTSYILRITFPDGTLAGCVMRDGECESAPAFNALTDRELFYLDWPVYLTDEAIRAHCKQAGYSCEKL